MQKMVPLIVAVVAALATGACGKGANSATDTDKISETIKAGEAQWVKDFAAKDVNALDAHFASDAVLAGPGYRATTDAERRSVLGGFVGDPNFKETFSSDRVDVATSGDLATSSGQFSMTMTDPTKKPVDIKGSYLTVYKKESDGSWKVVDRFLTRGPAPDIAPVDAG